MKKSKKFFIALISISLLIFIVRFEACRELFNTDILSSNPPFMKDMFLYKSYSEKIFDGTFSDAFYGQPFYFAAFLPTIYMFCGKGIWSVLLVQAFLGALSAYLIGLVTAMVRNRKAGLFAAGLFGLSFLANLYTAYLLIATLKIFLISLLLYLLVLALKKDKLFYWSLVALSIGILVLTRSNTLLFLPFILFFSFEKKIKESTDRKPKTVFKALAPAILILIIFIMIQLPVCIYNSMVTGKIQGTSTGATVVLAASNNPEAPPGKLTWSTTGLYWVDEKDKVSVTSRIISWVLEEPLVYCELIFRKLLLFWDNEELGNNLNNFQRYRNITTIFKFPFIPTSIYLVGFLMSIIALKKQFLMKREVLILILFSLVYWLSTVASMNLARYRLAAIPFFTIFSAFLVDDLFLKNGCRKKLFRLFLAFITSFFIVYLAYPVYRNFFEKKVFAIIQPDGMSSDLDDRTIYSDNGPVALGGHTPVQIIPGCVITKTFILEKPENNKKVDFQIVLKCMSKDPMTFSLNGKKFVIWPKKRNELDLGTRSISKFDMAVNFKLDFPIDGKIKLIAEKIPIGSVFCYIDVQRDFGRTMINGRKCPGELVSRLIVHE